MRGRAGLWLLLAPLVVAVLAWLLAERWITATVQDALDQSLLLTERAVEAEISRFQALPAVAGEDARIRAALTDPGALEAANLYLETVASHAGAAELFLIDADGVTVAASNWNDPTSYVGNFYGFRPYFKQAMQEGQGQFYAIGVTTRIPGYFLSRRIGTGESLGVLVVKLDLRGLEETWRAAGAEIALADADGVVFLSGRPDWLYRPLWTLSDGALTRLKATRAYDGVDLTVAPKLLSREAQGGNVAGRGWIGRLSTVKGPGWKLIATYPQAEISALAASWAFGAALLALFIAGLFKAWDQRRQIIALRLSQSERLEAMVAARTADLAREVEARTQAEADLRAAQEHLIHTEKMAALGRMSTAIVHEISQPLAAMEATLTAAEIGLPAGDAKTGPRLATAKGLIRRMQRTIKHLKSFGRKGPAELSLVDLRPVVQAAVELVTPRARAVGVLPEVDLPEEAALVMAGPVRMEQVAVNLILNALDAVEGRAGAEVRVGLEREGGQVRLYVRDSGHGIAADLLPRVAEPFFSTKTGGEGLGLGLSICKVIVAEFGGALEVRSEEGKGTEVVVSLPMAAKAREAAE